MLNDLNDKLKDLDNYISSKEIFPPASEKDILKLSDLVLSKFGTEIPSDLVVFFRWHNGQAKQNLFGKKYNKFLLSIDQATRAWEFFNDEQSEFLNPYESHWVPILSDAFGNYEMYDLRSGNLINYYHDDPERNISFKNLSEWAEYILSCLIEDNLKEPYILDNISILNIAVNVYLNNPCQDTSIVKDLRKNINASIKDILNAIKVGFPTPLHSVEFKTCLNSIGRLSELNSLINTIKFLENKGLMVKIGLSGIEDDEVWVNPQVLENLKTKCL